MVIPVRLAVTLASLLFLLLQSFDCPKALAVPILTDQSKQRVSSGASASSDKTVRILGHRGGITAVKRPADRTGNNVTSRSRRISAKSAIIIDAVNGRTIFSRSPDAGRQPASTIKVLTGTIAIDTLKNGESVEVSRKAARQPRSKIYLDHRRRYRADDLINAVLLASANDASVALAEKIAGSEDAFARLMTKRARSWGARNTVCRTASGLTARGQRSTARDLAGIFRMAMKNREFAARMKKARIRTSDGTLLHNHNKALWQIEGSLAGKTGYTNAARQTYVGKFRRGDREIIVAIMGSESMWTDIKRLVAIGFGSGKLALAPAGNKGYDLPLLTSTLKKRPVGSSAN